MNKSYLLELLKRLETEQEAEMYCCSDEYLKLLKIRIDERENLIKIIKSQIG